MYSRPGHRKGPRAPGVGTRSGWGKVLRGQAAARCSAVVPSCTTSWWTTFSVVASCAVRSARASTPTASASAKTSQVRSVPEKARAATSDHRAARPTRAVAELAAGPGGQHRAGAGDDGDGGRHAERDPAGHPGTSTSPRRRRGMRAASRKRLSRMNRELSLIMLRTSIALRFAQHLPSYRRVLAARRVAIFCFPDHRSMQHPFAIGKCPRGNVC